MKGLLLALAPLARASSDDPTPQVAAVDARADIALLREAVA